MQTKFIYKITNNINGKCYIGQTTNWKRRFQEHRNKGYGLEDNKILYRAFDKYGIDNFSFEVLEECENYNDREQYWIAYYNSCENGYNMTIGGDLPPLHIKEENPFATHSQNEVDEVIRLIITTKLQFKEIAEITNYDSSTIERINKGLLWHDDNLVYPLRKDRSPDFVLERALKIIDDLKNTNLTQKEIAEKYQVSRSAVTAINIGDNNRQPDITYPIRTPKKASDNNCAKPVLMLNAITLEVEEEFPSAAEAGRQLAERGLTKNPKSAASSIAQAIKSNLVKISYQHKWKFKEN